MKVSPVVDTSTNEAEQLIAAFCTKEDHDQIGLHTGKATKKDRLVARALTRELLIQETGSREWRLQADIRGKPFALGMDGTPGPFLSFSHAARKAVAVIDPHHPIGVDIEYWRPRNFDALAAYAFGPRECEEVTRCGMQAFYRIWCIREAMGKATGDGIMAQINGTDMVREFHAEDYEDGTWKIRHQALDHYSLAIASHV